MSTLLIYYSENEEIRALCEKSRMDGTAVCEIREHFDRSPAYVATLGAYLALTGKNAVIERTKTDLSAYDTIILAGSVWAMNPAPALNAFLRSNDLKGKEVIGLLFSSGLSSAIANDVLRKRIALAGGMCKGVVSIPKAELLKTQGGVLSLALQKAY